MTDVETVALREELARAAFAASWGVIDPDGLAPNYGRGGFKTQCLEWQAVADAILPLIARERAAALAAATPLIEARVAAALVDWLRSRGDCQSADDEIAAWLQLQTGNPQ